MPASFLAEERKFFIHEAGIYFIEYQHITRHQ